MRSGNWLAAVLLAAPVQARAWQPLTAATLERALSAEIRRSTSALQEPGYPPPYYLAVRVTDNRHHEARCVLGGVTYDDAHRHLAMTPDVRVGSYELDNHPLEPTDRYIGRELSGADDARAVRHSVWLKLDQDYKQAAADFLRKQAMRVQRGKTEYDTDDMTRETPLQRDAEPPPEDFEAQAPAADARCGALSAGLDADGVLGSFAEVQRDAEENWLFDSEGARVRWTTRWVRLEASAQAITDDGMRVNVHDSFMAPTVAALPDARALEQSARQITADLAALRAAPSTSPFNAPALLDPSVSAAVVTALADRLSGEEQRNPQGAQTFRDKRGKRVLPAFVSLDDKPSLKEFRGEPVVGGYAIDEQGVAAQDVTLVDHGVLKSYLLSRYPVLGFSHSNGHGRAASGQAPMGRASTLVLRAQGTAPLPELLRRLRGEALKRGKPYGLYIRKARAWSQQDKTGQQQALRLMPTLVYLVDARTGQQSLVRNLDMVGTPLDMLARILAAGDDDALTQALDDQPSGSLPVSTICPTLLVGDVEMQRSATKPERPPVLPPPR